MCAYVYLCMRAHDIFGSVVNKLTDMLSVKLYIFIYLVPIKYCFSRGKLQERFQRCDLGINKIEAAPLVSSATLHIQYI